MEDRRYNPGHPGYPVYQSQIPHRTSIFNTRLLPEMSSYQPSTRGGASVPPDAQKLWAFQDALSGTQSQLNRVLSIPSSPTESRRAKQDRDFHVEKFNHTIACLQEAIRQQLDIIKDKNIVIERQGETIRNQHDRVNHDRPSTQHIVNQSRQRTSVSARNDGTADQARRSGDANSKESNHTNAIYHTASIQPLNLLTRDSDPPDGFGPPRGSISSETANSDVVGTRTPFNTPAEQAVMNTSPRSLSVSVASGDIVYPTTSNKMYANAEKEMSAKYMLLFDKALQWSYKYANKINPAQDARLPQPLKDKLIAASHLTNASRIMKTPDQRVYLIAKILVQMVEKNMLTRESFYGFDAKIDGSIKKCYKRFDELKFGEELRAQIGDEIAVQSQMLHNLPGIGKFKYNLAYQRASKCLDVVKPLIEGDPDAAWGALWHFIQHGHVLAMAINNTASEYKTKWPSAKDKFDVSTMVPLNPQWDARLPTNLKDIDHDVVLGASPQVEYRNHELGRSTRMIVKAGVIIERSKNSRVNYNW